MTEQLFTAITPEQQAAYLADANHCPYCGSTQIKGGERDVQDDNTTQNIRCTTCGREWIDIHTLTGVEDADTYCCLCNSQLTVGDVVDKTDEGLAHKACSLNQ
jgi:formate dehydrogenase maturation protein FdhE